MKILIADDEKRAREFLTSLLLEIYPESQVYSASDGFDALLKIKKSLFDLVFLDIEMPKLSGIEVAQSCYEDGIRVIFATAYHSYALQATEVSALDYILKPFNKERLQTAILKSKDSKEFSPMKKSGSLLEKVCFKVDGNYKVFDCKAISSIVRLDDYLELYF